MTHHPAAVAAMDHRAVVATTAYSPAGVRDVHGVRYTFLLELASALQEFGERVSITPSDGAGYTYQLHDKSSGIGAE